MVDRTDSLNRRDSLEPAESLLSTDLMNVHYYECDTNCDEVNILLVAVIYINPITVTDNRCTCHARKPAYNLLS